MHKFDTKVQYLKYQVLREVARHAWNDTLVENVMDIPRTIVPGNKPTMRCCVYKERAILGERVKLAMGGNKDNPNVIEVIETACDESLHRLTKQNARNAELVRRYVRIRQLSAVNARVKMPAR